MGRPGDLVDRAIPSPRLGVRARNAEVAHGRSPRIGVLAGILDVAIDDRRLTNNPARHIRNLPRSGLGKRRVYLSHDQVATLAARSAHPTMVLTLAYTGLRWGEANGLRLRSVNRLRRRFVIEENAVMIAYEIHVGTPKTHERRSVPYPPRLAPVIEEACAGALPAGPQTRYARPQQPSSRLLNLRARHIAPKPPRFGVLRRQTTLRGRRCWPSKFAP